MIIKSTSRRDNNFSQLIEYIHRDGTSRGADSFTNFTYVHNIDVKPGERRKIIEAFYENDVHRKRRKGGVSQYHEILSFSPDDTKTIEQNPNILWDVATRYINLRAPNSLAVAKPHYDKHYHIHVVFSANEEGSGKSIRISKKKFDQIKDQLRSYTREIYPELKHSFQKGQTKNIEETQEQKIERTSDGKRDLKKPGSSSHKDYLRTRLEEGLQQKDYKSFAALFAEGECRLYERNGRLTGLRYKNKKYRFKTLFKNAPEQLQAFEEYQKEFKKEWQYRNRMEELKKIEHDKERSINPNDRSIIRERKNINHE